VALGRALGLASRLLLLALVAVTGAACRQGRAQVLSDAGADANGSDGNAPLSLAISVTGCAAQAYGAGAGGFCSGPAPLMLVFSPVGSPDFARFKWSFGDGTPDVSARAPTHGFPLPGSYQVTLTAVLAGGGTVQSGLLVLVDALAAGSPCDVDAQCAPGLACACAPGSGCSAAFVRGICSAGCATTACGADAVCAAVPLAPPADGGAAAPAPWCVASCPTGTACPPGLVCQTLPAAGAAAASPWARGCVPLGTLADVGAPCRDANGALDDDACATGLCADLGALGVCSAACDAGRPCPDGTVCTSFADGRRLCLVTCGGATTCVRDPLLACSSSPSGDAGAGFQADAAAGTEICGPKPCMGDGDCAPSGQCGAGGACVRL
jgi:hypothetical protein